MNADQNNEVVSIEPETESFRGYITVLDQQMEAGGTIAIPFIAFAKMSGADVDKIFVKEDFEKYMQSTAEEYGMNIIAHNSKPGAFGVK